MIAQIASVWALGFAVWAIWTTAKAKRVSHSALRTSLFSDFYSKIAELEELRGTGIDTGISQNWRVQLLGHLEFLAGLINNGDVSFRMAGRNREMIMCYYDNLLSGQEKKAETFVELNKLYAKLKIHAAVIPVA